MGLIVQKYGGTSVGNADRMRRVAERLLATKRAGHEVVAVVSAMAGVTDNLVRPAAPSIAPGDARITITLNQIPLGEALRYIASQAGLKVKVEPYAVSIIPISDQSSDLFTKEYRVPPGFISSSVNVGASALNQGPTRVGSGGTGRDTQGSTGGQQLVNRQTALDFLKDQGVPFSPGASANFLPQSSRLIVRNTEENLELVDALVEQANVSGPKQVEIEAKFVEITQNNLKELGFDWLLGQFNVPGTTKRTAFVFRLSQSDFHEPVNIGNPREMTIKQFAEEIIRITETKSGIEYKPLPVDDPTVRQPDIGRAREVLAFSVRLYAKLLTRPQRSEHD